MNICFCRSRAIKRKILVIDDTDTFYSWMKIELGADFGIEYTGCPATAYLSSLEQHYHALVVHELRMDAVSTIFSKHSSPIFLTSDVYNPLVIHRAKKNDFAGYFLRTESSRLFIRAILNPSLRKFWLSEKAEIEVHDLPIFSLYYQLTSREKEIFPLLADGMGYKEIGFKLGISSKTVLSHRERLMKKMHFETNTDLIKAALKLGVTQL